MARAVKNPKIDTRTARLAKLEPRREPYWAAITPGLALGYRRTAKGGGTWIGRWRDSVGKQHTHAIGAADDYADADGMTVLTFGQAQERARAWRETMLAREQEEDDEDEAPAPVVPITVAEAIDAYLVALERGDGRSKTGGVKSLKTTRVAVEAHIIPALGDVLLGDLTTKRIKKWHQDLADKPARVRTKFGSTQKYRSSNSDPDEEELRRRKSTANRVLTILKAALNHAFADEKVSSDTAWRVVKPFKNADACRVRYLDRSECRRLINACDEDLRLLVRGALYTGCRYGELTRALVSDFDRDSGTLHVRTSKSGKGRHVELTEEGLAFLDEVSAGRPGAEYLFVRDDGKAWGKSWQQRPMYKACTRGGIVPKITFHELRHSYASILIMDGVPLMVVAKNLGHSDTRMVEKHYGHLAQSYVRDTIRAVKPIGDVEVAKVVRIRQ